MTVFPQHVHQLHRSHTIQAMKHYRTRQVQTTQQEKQTSENGTRHHTTAAQRPVADTLLQHHVLADTFSTFSPLNEKDDVTDENKKEKHEQTTNEKTKR